MVFSFIFVICLKTSLPLSSVRPSELITQSDFNTSPDQLIVNISNDSLPNIVSKPVNIVPTLVLSPGSYGFSTGLQQTRGGDRRLYDSFTLKTSFTLQREAQVCLFEQCGVAL